MGITMSNNLSILQIVKFITIIIIDIILYSYFFNK